MRSQRANIGSRRVFCRPKIRSDGNRSVSSSIHRNLKQALTKPPERFGIDRLEHLTLIDALRFLAPDYLMERLRHFGRATLALRYSDWIAAALVTLCALYLHALFFLNAGGLWRDEVDLFNLSLLPLFSRGWQNLPHDSCPILMHLLVRAWSAVSLGNSDPGLRVLGLVIGLFLLLAFWFASWTMRNGAPVLAVTLAGLNVTMVRAGDSLRGYGLGSALAVLTLAVIWRLTCRPSLAAFSCAVAVAILSVQSLYQNAFFVFAACCGGFMLCAVERRWRDTLPIFVVGVAAAVSLLPY